MELKLPAQMSSLPDLATNREHLGPYYFYKLVNGHLDFLISHYLFTLSIIPTVMVDPI
jgi:hypothetical protein